MVPGGVTRLVRAGWWLVGRGTNEAVRARKARDGRRLTREVATAVQAEWRATAAAAVRASWAELRAAHERGDGLMAERLTIQLGALVAGLRGAGVSTAKVADLVGAPAALVRRWLQAAGGGR